jgi:hypothetical protein
MAGLADAGLGRPTGVAKPSAECVRSVQFSCQLVQRKEAEFAEQFFQSVYNDVRWVREMPQDQRRPLCDGLARSVLWAGLTQDSDDLIESALREVGARYKRDGLPEEWYREFGKSLLYALRHMHPSDWGPRLSSDWVAYYMWLCEFIRLGAINAPADGPGSRYSVGHPSDAGPAGVTVIESLGDIVAELRARYFQDNERSLAAICTRVALRTGTDLRNPRPDQNTDPVAIANVLSTLLVLGYSIKSFSIDAATEDYREEAEAAASDPGGGRNYRSRSLRRGISRIFGRGSR